MRGTALLTFSAAASSVAGSASNAPASSGAFRTAQCRVAVQGAVQGSTRAQHSRVAGMERAPSGRPWLATPRAPRSAAGTRRRGRPVRHPELRSQLTPAHTKSAYTGSHKVSLHRLTQSQLTPAHAKSAYTGSHKATRVGMLIWGFRRAVARPLCQHTSLKTRGGKVN